MLTDGLFDYKVANVKANFDEPINFIFIGDEHFNSPSFARTKWEQDMKQLREDCKKTQTFFIKTGDTFEALSTSERKVFNSGGFHDSNTNRWEKEYLKEVGDYVKQADFMVGRTLAVFGGNHFFKFYDGTTSDMVLANLLNASYIGVCGYVIVNIYSNERQQTLKIFVHHGKSSGKRVGSAFTALEDAASYFVDADILVMGHDHKAGAMSLPGLRCSTGNGQYKIKEFDRIIGRSGSYLKSYEPGKASYAVDAMYRPSTLGYLKVTVTPRRGQDGKTDRRWLQLNAQI